MSTAPPTSRTRPAVRLEAESVRYPGFAPGETVLPAASVHEEGALPLPCDILATRDVAVGLRDGTTIYADIYRPVGAADVPAIIAWSPYGKRAGAIQQGDFPFRAGVPRSVTSGLEKFEGPDPAYWCARGYAIVNPDTRGAYSSEGDIRFWSRREGQDGADVVDWVGGQAWSNGKVGMAGTSWLAIAQWFIAAERPRHLAAIAPWEGLADTYRNGVAPGGIVDPGFIDWLTAIAVGGGNIDDLTAMIQEFPLVDAWEEHIADVGRIRVPAYVGASWANVLHSRGTFEAWRSLGSRDRWLRVHDSLEWPDFYQPHNQDDLLRFFDRYLLDVDNGWEATPPVRLDIVDPGHAHVPNQAEDAFPPNRVQLRELFLGAEERLSADAGAAAQISYDAVEGAAEFSWTFSSDVELIGYPVLTVFVEADGADDVDLFAKITKVDGRGEPLGVQLLPLQWAENAAVSTQIAELAEGHLRSLYYYDGPWARLRASHRELDQSRSEPVPRHAHRAEQRLTPGEVVELTLGFTAIGMRFHSGETLKLIVTGKNTTVWAAPNITQPTLRNAGTHTLHLGTEHPSRLHLPVARVRGDL